MWLILTATFCALTAAASLRWALIANLAAHHARAALESLQARVASLESATKLTTSSLAETTDVLTDLANRVKMQRVRAAVSHGDKSKPDGDPDPHREPDRWRDWMNAKLAKARVGIN